MSTSNKLSLSSLPLPVASQLLTQNLTPDPQTPSPTTFFSDVLQNKPSLQRRARLLSPRSHFSYVSPLPLPFPYEIAPPEPPEVIEEKDKPAYVEKWLSAREAIHLKDQDQSRESHCLMKHYPHNREQPRELIGLAETGIKDCVPNLDVGDAFELLGNPALVSSESPPPPSELNAARDDLVDILSGHAVLMSDQFAPWSLRYSGHQFGVWAGQLGDGRAISILTTPHPSHSELTYELQLKGSGRTPFSRSADGLAVLRSSIREFLGSEAMQALNIPTTRSLSLISLPHLSVQRERRETGCVLTRMAPSFLRIGSFEALNAPQGMFFLGGGQQEADWEGLRVLGEWVGRNVLRLEGIGEGGGAWGRKLVLEVARRNAEMVAGWQAYGFMHGVMNTDNISVLGLTIDYGPYAFMDVFDPYHICNHTDEEGRYAYKYQPNMILYACRHLLSAISPLIGAEFALGGKAVGPNWAQGASDEIMGEWKQKALDAVKEEMEVLIQETCSVEYGKLMRKRLALRRVDKSDETKIVQPLLNILEEHKLDFHGTFRRISVFRPSLLEGGQPSDPNNTQLDRFVSGILALSPEAETMDHGKATKDFLEWLHKYSERILSEGDLWKDEADVDLARENAAKGANPRFVLRQWVLEDVIKKVEKDTGSGKRILGKVLQMACNPFEPWGAEGDQRADSELDAEIREERRYCGMGDKAMLGFQCSCSS